MSPHTHPSRCELRPLGIDAWDGNLSDPPDHLEIQIDQPNFVLWTLRRNDWMDRSVNFCAVTDIDRRDLTPFIVFLNMPHTATTFQIISSGALNQWTVNESLGFRDIVFNFANSQRVTSHCGVADFPLLRPDACTCQGGLVEKTDTSGICVKSDGQNGCSIGCDRCQGPEANQCITCVAQKYLTPESTCQSCNPVCGSCSGSADFCTSCQTNYFLVDHTYYPSCQSPLTQVTSGGVNYCYTPCSSASLYAY